MTAMGNFVDLIDRLSRMAHAVQFAEGLNPAQWEAMRYLSRANRYSGSPGVLADYLGTTKGTASQTLIALEAKGLVARERSVTDRRKVRLALTDAGRELLARDPLHRIEQAGSAISEAQRSLLIEAMDQIVDGLCRRSGGPQFGKCGDCCHMRGKCQSGCACGLTGEELGLSELDQICVNFSPSA